MYVESCWWITSGSGVESGSMRWICASALKTDSVTSVTRSIGKSKNLTPQGWLFWRARASTPMSTMLVLAGSNSGGRYTAMFFSWLIVFQYALSVAIVKYTSPALIGISGGGRYVTSTGAP